jgi:hypothetical protein
MYLVLIKLADVQGHMPAQMTLSSETNAHYTLRMLHAGVGLNWYVIRWTICLLRLSDPFVIDGCTWCMWTVPGRAVLRADR